MNNDIEEKLPDAAVKLLSQKLQGALKDDDKAKEEPKVKGLSSDVFSLVLSELSGFVECFN